jgi:hypothetical protein
MFTSRRSRQERLSSVSGIGYERHVLERSVVLPELRLLFLPVPKAGCTTMLLLLAELAGLKAETFERSARPEVSPALAVHDMSLWRPEHRLAHYDGHRRAEMLAADDWLRFAVVRDPRTRLWSSWQSKLLLREPRFADAFGSEPWFPRVPQRPSDLVEDFRAFITAIGEGGAEDVHWASQAALTRRLPLTHIGRVERLDATLALVREHVASAAASPASANVSAIALPRGAYDDDAAAVLRRCFRADFDAFGYDDRVDDIGVDQDEWELRVAEALPGVRTSIEHSRRIGELHRIAERRAQRVHAAHRRLQELGARRNGPARAPALANIEGAAEYDARWRWDEGALAPGVTAVLRVRDEARSLPWVLPPLLRAVDRVVLVDNGSTDGTAMVARSVASRLGATERLEIHDYPFAVARCGDEHLATPAASVHSLVHFYNWSFAQVQTSYALKWDGDMVLTDAAVAALRDLAWQLEAAEMVIKVPRYPLYVADDRLAFIDVGMRNCEAWGWPNRPGYRFVKALDWELPLWGGEPGTVVLPDWSCVELKHLDADEFAHWSHTDFEASARTQRKRREWDVFRTLRADTDLPLGVEAIEAPPGSHVIAHVRETWLPARAVSDGSLPRRRRAFAPAVARAS